MVDVDVGVGEGSGQVTLLRSCVAALVVAVTWLAAGCAAEPQDPGLQPATPSQVRVYESARTADGYRLRPVMAKVPERVQGQSPYTSDAMRAVAALLEHTPATPVGRTLWNGDCAPGGEVTAVEISEDRVTVRLDDWNGTICELTAEAAVIRGQQVAWTIISNAKGELGRPPFPEIVVHDASGSRWEPIEPDESFLPPGEDY
jgi:hypothetical protein